MTTAAELIKQAHELLTGVWEPEAKDREAFIAKLKAAVVVPPITEVVRRGVKATLSPLGRCNHELADVVVDLGDPAESAYLDSTSKGEDLVRFKILTPHPTKPGKRLRSCAWINLSRFYSGKAPTLELIVRNRKREVKREITVQPWLQVDAATGEPGKDDLP